ncbi:uncharacterized protein LOC131174666 [Hevea brasiliensis]|uniref:uncharacterized protein LOC131174666 n=1 Tax=Hevea brasiliensis TaxID=3981 RepID=UPI0025EBAB91|nr:uncharacterized protein LOC131174666 [Hevea brasiliensis]
MPNVDSPLLEKWQCVDSMVLSWILNTISKDIIDAFLYVTFVQELWNELKQRFGGSNGPMLYQIKWEINSFSQANLPLMVYFTKVNKLRDELSCLRKFPVCTCSVAKVVADIEEEDKLIQFLMGLNDNYEHVRSQILLHDPLPVVNKAYSMILSVEKQREVLSISDSVDHASAMLVKDVNAPKNQNFTTNRIRDFFKKEDKFCFHCKAQGHVRETCFKLHGYPNWYKELQQK